MFKPRAGDYQRWAAFQYRSARAMTNIGYACDAIMAQRKAADYSLSARKMVTIEAGRRKLRRLPRARFNAR